MNYISVEDSSKFFVEIFTGMGKVNDDKFFLIINSIGGSIRGVIDFEMERVEEMQRPGEFFSGIRIFLKKFGFFDQRLSYISREFFE